MLEINILNVGKGDSIILSFTSDMKTHYGVIDVYKTGDQTSIPALEFLKHRAAQELSFVMLTHPHTDHYTGMLSLLKTYTVNDFYSFPIGDLNTGKLKKLGERLREEYNNTNDQGIKNGTIELLEILKHCKDVIGIDNWHDQSGIDSAIRPKGFSGCTVSTILPHRLDKGPFNQFIEGQLKNKSIFNPEYNDISLAVKIEYAGHKIILGGDGTKKSWMYHKRKWGDNSEELNANFVKLPHHGSKHDNDEDTLKYIYGGNSGSHAFVSADGKAHPHSETLKLLAQLGIEPYCTNLSKLCGGAKVQNLITDTEIDATLVKFINSMAEDSPDIGSPCQGNISLRIDAKGNFNVSTEHNNSCPFRSDIFSSPPLS